jgi:hypothetical protein
MGILSNEFYEIRELLTLAKALLDVCEAGPERDQMQGKLDRTFKAVMELPKNVAAQAPFKTGDDFEAAVAAECRSIVAAIDHVN